jgi:hypothetical protein
MIELTAQEVERYVRKVHGAEARLVSVGAIGGKEGQGIKGFGYGKPLLVRYELRDETHEEVLSVMRGDKYGHQFYWDRAGILLFQYETSGLLEGHVKSLGVGYVNAEDRLVPLDRPKEFFLVSEKAEGYDYYRDLARIRGGDFRKGDLALARGLAAWAARIHSLRHADPDLYFRSVRNLIGKSECIMGLVDEAYPHPYPEFSEERFQALEAGVVRWRWKLKGFAHRLAASHGDFHPWNVLVEESGAFRVLDRSRGQWGEPADDVSTMAANYLLFALLDRGRVAGPFAELYRAFFAEYLERTNDAEMLRVMAPFLVFRGLVIASPEWYPDHPPAVRQGLLRLIENVLADDIFDWAHVGKYLE